MKSIYKIILICLIFIILLVLYFTFNYELNKYFKNNGVDKKNIIIGQSIDLSGKILGSKSFHLGFTTAIDKYNREGGIHGRRIIYRVLDDNNNPEKALENIKLLINFYNSFCIFGSYGETCTNKIVPYITDYGIPLIAPSSGALEFREPFNKYIINCQASYYNEICKILNFMKKQTKYNFSIIFDNTNNLISILEKILLTMNEMKNFNFMSYGVIEDNLYKGLSQILKDETPFNNSINRNILDKLDFIIICSNEENTAKIVKYFKNIKPDIYCFYLSSVNTVYTASLIRKYLKNFNNVYATTVTYKDPKNSICQEYQKELNANKYKNIEPKMSFKSLSGYIAGKYFCEVLLKVGKNLTRNNFISYVYENKISFNNINFDKFVMYKSNQGTNDCYLYELTLDENDIKLIEF
jgi:branched-chain amino acid transport system substrate-binding protein